MANLVVFAFDNLEGASQMEEKLLSLQKQELIKVEDAAVVTRKDDGKPKVKQLNSLVGAGAWGGAFWGMLIGLLFWAPWLGMALGAVTGALSGKASDIGIDDSFIKEVAETIEPGHSAIFLMTTDAVTDKVMPEVKALNPTLIQTNLSTEQESKLKEMLAE